LNDVAVKKPKTSEIDIEAGLLALAAHNGNSRKAAAFLAGQQGSQHDHTTLWEWKHRYPERYQALRAEILPKIREQAADEHMDLAQKAMSAEAKVLARLDKEVDDLPVKELPGAARNMAVASAVHSEKAQLFNDQPTGRVSVDLPSLIREAKSLGIEPTKVLNLEAEEIDS